MVSFGRDVYRNVALQRWPALLFIMVVPAFIVGLISFLSPRSYETRMSYSLSLDAVGFTKLQARFFSEENLRALTGDLFAQGATDIVHDIENAESDDDLEKIVSFNVMPQYITFSSRKNLKLSLGRSWAENIEKLERLQSHLLIINVGQASNEDLPLLASWVNQFMTSIRPAYELKDQLKNRILAHNHRIAKSERALIFYNLDLERVTATLASLSSLEDIDRDSDASVQIVVGEGNRKHDEAAASDFGDDLAESRLLPLDMQIQYYAAERTRIQHMISDQIAQVATMRDRLKVLESLHAQLTQDVARGGYQVTSYIEKLHSQLEAKQDPHVSQFVHSLILDANSSLQEAEPVAGSGRVVPLARHTFAKMALAAVICLMLALLWLSMLVYGQRRHGAP